MHAANRKQNNHHSQRSLRRWFSPRRCRHDPWLVFNMANFTFESQPLHGFTRFASHESIGR